MTRINWQNVSAPSLESAVRLVADTYANKQKALGDLIGVGSEFAKNVQQANHDEIKNYIDSLSRDELKNRDVVNAKVNELGGDWFGYDKGVVGTYLDSRVPIMNTRTVDDINTQNSVDKDSIDRYTTELLPFAVDTFLDPTAQSSRDTVMGGLERIDDPYIKGKVMSNLQQSSSKQALDITQNISGLDKVIYDKDMQVLNQYINQADYLRRQLRVGNNLGIEDLKHNLEINKQLLALENNDIIKKYNGEYRQGIQKLADSQLKSEYDIAKTKADINRTNAQTFGLYAGVEQDKQNAKIQAQQNAQKIQHEQDKLTIQTYEKQVKDKKDNALKLGFPSQVINDDTSINLGALKEHYNQVLRGVEVSEYSQKSNHDTLSSYLADPKTQKLIQSQDHLTSGWVDSLTPKGIADSDRLNKLQIELNSQRHNGKPLPEWLKISMAEKVISNPSIFTFGGDTADIQQFVKNELNEYDKGATAYRENLYKTRVVDFWNKALQLGVPAHKLVLDLGITSKSKEFGFLTKDLQEVVLLKEKEKSSNPSGEPREINKTNLDKAVQALKESKEINQNPNLTTQQKLQAIMEIKKKYNI